MAGYLATGMPGDYYSDDFAKSFDFSSYLYNQRQKEEAFKNQAINRDMALEDLYNTQQTNPIKRQGFILDNQTKEAQLPGIKADSSLKTMNLEDATTSREARLKATLAKLARETSDEELKQEQRQIEKMLLSPHIGANDRKRLEFLRDQFTELYKLREQLTSKEDVASIGANSRIVAASTPRPAREGSNAPKGPKKLEELETSYLKEALEASDPAVRAAALEKATTVREAINSALQAKADAGLTGKPDLGTMGVPVSPGIVTTPNSATTGRPARQAAVKAPAGRVVIYKDGKPVGTVPVAQKEAAKQQGYTVD